MFQNLSDKDYHSQPFLSSTELRWFMDHPEKYAWKKAHKPPSTDSQRLGRLIHLACLQPSEFAAQVVVAPKCDRRTKAGREQYEAFRSDLGDKELCDEQEFEQICSMAESFNRRVCLSETYGEAPLFEKSLFAELEGVAVKARPDVVFPENRIMVDLKSCLACDPQTFAYEARRYGYHIQSAFYTLVAQASRSEPWATFEFIAIEKQAPYLVSVVSIGPSALLAAQQRVLAELRTFAACQLFDSWTKPIRRGQLEDLVNLNRQPEGDDSEL